MKSNPFEGPAANGKSPQPDQEITDARFSSIVVAMHFVRIALACCVFIFLPLFVIPYCVEIYEEFGIELPAITLALIAFSSIWQRYFWITIPLTFAVSIGLEIAILRISNRSIQMIASLLYWLALIFLLAGSVWALWTPYQAIVSGLN